MFGDDVDSTLLHNVDCFGDEDNLLHCPLSYTGLCAGHNAAVLCQSRLILFPKKLICEYLFFLSGVDTEASNCSDGELRLSGAALTNQGRLEVCVNGAWGSVCDSQGVFTTDEAKVACRQLGILQVEGSRICLSIQ